MYSGFNQIHGLFHAFDSVGGYIPDRIDHRSYFFCRYDSAFSKFTNFICDHGKTTSLLSGSCGLNGCIQCKEVGLLGYFGDYRNNP